MEYLIDTYNINAVYSISIHDMIQYLCAEEDRYRCVLAFQLAHMYTRAYFSIKCNIPELPLNCAFFSSVEVDRAMRYSPSDQLDPTVALHTDIPFGESLNINDVLEKTNGTLQQY